MTGFLERFLAAGTATMLFVGVVTAKETIVFVRHGEKPPHGLGQLDCRGLNRALALPAVIQKSFGKPDAIFAPNPSDQKKDEGEHYDYVRPLTTIEPTAIAFGMPVNARIGYDDTEGLRKALENPAYRDALVLVGWEHAIIGAVARELLSVHGGNPSDVPDWNRDDFDSVYVVTIDWTGPKPKATFSLASEGLNGQPETCPK
jgi:hypothetical protein